MKTLYTKYGFTFYLSERDGGTVGVFIETSRKNKTDKLVLACLNSIQNQINSYHFIGNETIAYYKKRMKPAMLEIQQAENGAYVGKYCANIHGEDFGGYGTDLIEKENLFDYNNGGIIYIKLD